MYKFEKYDKGVVSVAFSRGLMVHSGSTGGGTDNIDVDTTNNLTNQNDNQTNQTSTSSTMKAVPIPPPPGLGSTERELEYIVRDTLSSCILLDRYPRCVIQVVLQIVQADGCVLGSAINCALLALMDCGIAMWGLPVASTCVVIPRSCYTDSSDSEEKGEENTIWLDPTAEEEGGVGHSIVALVTDGSAKQQQIKEEGESDDEDIITSMTFGAPLSLKGLLSSMKCMKQSSATAMLAFMRLAVEQKVQREVETLWS